MAPPIRTGGWMLSQRLRLDIMSLLTRLFCPANCQRVIHELSDCLIPLCCRFRSAGVRLAVCGLSWEAHSGRKTANRRWRAGQNDVPGSGALSLFALAFSAVAFSA